MIVTIVIHCQHFNNNNFRCELRFCAFVKSDKETWAEILAHKTKSEEKYFHLKENVNAHRRDWGAVLIQILLIGPVSQMKRIH